MLSNFENHLKLHTDSTATVERYTQVLIDFFKTTTEFSQDTVNKYLTDTIETKSASSVNIAISAFKKYNVFTKGDVEFPKYRKVAKSIKATVNRDEIEIEILPYFDSIFIDSKKRKLLFRFMMLTMCRKSEIYSLKKECIDFKTNRINIYHAKGNKNRIVFLHRSIAEDIKQFITTHNAETVFNINAGYIEYMFLQINNMLNYKKQLSAHSLRHAGALHFYETTHDLKALQEILGHSDISTTERYVRGYELDKIQEQYNRIKYKKGK